MNRIKLLYDVVTKLREKKAVRGEMQAIGLKDERQVLEAQNLFERNWQTGLMKAQIRAEWEYGGHKLKHESSTELTGECCGDRFHRLRGPMYAHHPHSVEQGGFRRPLNRLALFLYALNNLQAEEREDGYVELMFDMTELPDFMKEDLHQKMQQLMRFDQEEHQSIMKLLCAVAPPKITVQMRINPELEIERILFTLSGEERGEDGVNHEMNLGVEVNLSW